MTQKFWSPQAWRLKMFTHCKLSVKIFNRLALVTKNFWLPHDWQHNTFDRTSLAIESIPLPIMWWLNFFQSSHMYGSRLFNWWWINLWHWFGDKIWFGHGNIESFNGRRIYFNISNGRGSKFHPLTNSIEGPNKCTNNNTQTFRQVSLPERLNSAPK